MDSRAEFEAGLDPERLRAGFAYWCSLLEKGEDVPRFSRFEPSAIPRLLSNIILLEVREAPLDFRYRVIGQDVVDNLFANYTGQWLSDIPHQAEPGPLIDSLGAAVRERRPIHSSAPYIGPKRGYKAKHEIVLPLCDDDGRISRLLIFLEFTLKAGYRRPVF